MLGICSCRLDCWLQVVLQVSVGVDGLMGLCAEVDVDEGGSWSRR